MKGKLAADARDALLQTLEVRFSSHRNRHPNIEWADVRKRLEEQPEALWTLAEMERTGGVPDVVELTLQPGLAQDVDGDDTEETIVFVDCAPESPDGRRSLCFDEAARESRKENKPAGSAVGMAEAMGVRLLTEAEYRALQGLFPFDQKTSSWVATPEEIRSRGGALFCDRRYNAVFLYHNGADSYYGARGFRGVLAL